MGCTSHDTAWGSNKKHSTMCWSCDDFRQAARPGMMLPPASLCLKSWAQRSQVLCHHRPKKRRKPSSPHQRFRSHASPWLSCQAEVFMTKETGRYECQNCRALNFCTSRGWPRRLGVQPLLWFGQLWSWHEMGGAADQSCGNQVQIT